jgi:pimeloyl-ACP methyl ester carboxylesterase
MGYMEKFLLPALGVSYEQVAGDVSMSGVEAHLRQDKRVLLMHNSDDFILNPGELEYLQGVFGSRMQTYPHGGHVGNIWYPENLEFILGSFAGL